MRHYSASISVAILVVLSLIAGADTRGQTAGRNRPPVKKRTQAEAPAGAKIASTSPREQPARGSRPARPKPAVRTKATDLLRAGHADPSAYQKKRSVTDSNAPKVKKRAPAPKAKSVMRPRPAPAGQMRRDRDLVNGVVPQDGIYRHPEGSEVRREPDPRAGLAKLKAPAKKAGPPPKRYDSANAGKPPAG